MKLIPFEEILSKSKEQLDKAMAPLRARNVKSKAELKMSEFDMKLLTLETEVQEMLTNKDVDFDRLMAKLDEYALIERRKNQYVKILADLFPKKK